MEAAQPELNLLRKLMVDHPALVVAGATTALGSLRLLAIAHGDASLAAYLATSAGPSALLALTLTSAVPSLFMVLMLTVLTTLFGNPLSERVGYVAAGLLILLGVPVLSVFSLGNVVLVLVLVVGMGQYQLRRYRRGVLTRPMPGLDERRKSEWLLLSIAAMPLALITVSSSPWLPPETIAPAGQPARTGYVLAEGGRRLVVLDDERRALTSYDADSTERSFCSMARATLGPSWLWLSIPGALSGAYEHRQPACPRS